MIADQSNIFLDYVKIINLLKCKIIIGCETGEQPLYLDPFQIFNGCHLETMQDIYKLFGRMIDLCFSHFWDFFSDHFE